MIDRRMALLGGAVALGLPLTSAAGPSSQADGRLPETRAGGRPLTLTAQPREIELIPGRRTPAWLYGDHLFPVLRLRRGETLDVTLDNRLGEHSSLHWHGVRCPNAMDGVPFLTQRPVQPGERFAYRFTPPDAGTFFFHPHCDSAAQLGRGLTGALIVEAPEDAGLDDDVVLVIKDWRLAEDGGFLPFLTPATASRAGAFGTLRTVNGLNRPEIAVRAGEVRLRLINADASRICAIGVTGGEARILAVDGMSIGPLPLDRWRLGPGMRLDLVVKAEPGARIALLDDFSATPETLAVLVAGKDSGSASAPLRMVPPPASLDLANAERHSLMLGAAAEAAPTDLPEPIVLSDGRRIDLADQLCLASGGFWTLDGQSWPMRDHGRLPPPLMRLERGRSVVLELFNATPHAHPIHLHGHSFEVLSASRLQRPRHHADTVLVMPNERVEVAFRADNPGAWMIHCHIIEHQETGMMGWLLVS